MPECMETIQSPGGLKKMRQIRVTCLSCFAVRNVDCSAIIAMAHHSPQPSLELFNNSSVEVLMISTQFLKYLDFIPLFLSRSLVFLIDIPFLISQKLQV